MKISHIKFFALLFPMLWGAALVLTLQQLFFPELHEFIEENSEAALVTLTTLLAATVFVYRAARRVVNAGTGRKPE